MPNDTILVTGATGKQGGATARRLLAAGVPVRALVRDAATPGALELASAGAELAVGDLDDRDSVSAAVTDVRAVFAVPPAAYGAGGWDIDLEAHRGERLVEACRAAGVDQFVFTGVASFEQPGSWGAEGKRRIEAAVAASGMRWTVLRPVRFMENYFLPKGAVEGIEDGVHRHLFPADRPIQVIAVDDIAAFAVLVLADPDRFHGHTYELAGDALTMPAAAAAIARATGTALRYEEIGESEALALGPEIAAVWRLSRSGRGWHADIPALRELLPGLRTFETWLSETGAARLKSLMNG
ncbi:NmrA family NAD(P)-binding protein [Nocardia otitidiscaviarum]|uniref:NmrA family NAD(P)-binding protein n=1 Tax=Nocardia otitidiscaviarum TaxID=1823 RepID=UPI00189473A3|nr:NmrA family NAD(P)-binding protein [Nocardia otitidiscaviarum]MBF6182612.1 NmrA family NAD(P)-binding protein [Nocardia otitidiscaviarum]